MMKIIDPRFPLGSPINRPPPEPVWLAIPGRPGWLRHRESGREIYVDPPARSVKLLTG